MNYFNKQKIVKFIEEECKDLHTFIGEDWVAFTNYAGQRTIVNFSKGYAYIKDFAEDTREENANFKRSRKNTV